MYKVYPTEMKTSIGQKINRPFSQQKEYKENKGSKKQSQSCDKQNLSTILKGKQQIQNKTKPSQMRLQIQQPQSLQTTHRYNHSPYIKSANQHQQLFELQKTIMADTSRCTNAVNQMKYHSQSKRNSEVNNFKQSQYPSYEKKTQSLNGSFELKKRIFTSNLENNYQTGIVKNNRAQSVIDEYKTAELQQTMKIPEPIIQQRIIPYDSETEFEGYRKGEFLTFESDSCDEQIRRDGIENFLKNLSDQEILLLEKYIYLRKYDMAQRKMQNRNQTDKYSTTIRTQYAQQQQGKFSRQIKK